jgi:hypothetical protein
VYGCTIEQEQEGKHKRDLFREYIRNENKFEKKLKTAGSRTIWTGFTDDNFFISERVKKSNFVCSYTLSKTKIPSFTLSGCKTRYLLCILLIFSNYAERQALELILSQNLIKPQTTDNQVQITT